MPVVPSSFSALTCACSSATRAVLEPFFAPTIENQLVIQRSALDGNIVGVGLAFEHVAFGLQRRAQLFVVFNNAVMDQRHAARAGRAARAGAVAEMRVRVVYGGRTVRGPARVRNAGGAFEIFGIDLRLKFGHARGAARALEPAGMHGHAAGVIAPVFEPLQALHKDGDDILGRNRCNNAAHKPCT